MGAMIVEEFLGLYGDHDISRCPVRKAWLLVQCSFVESEGDVQGRLYGYYCSPYLGLDEGELFRLDAPCCRKSKTPRNSTKLCNYRIGSYSSLDPDTDTIMNLEVDLPSWQSRPKATWRSPLTVASCPFYSRHIVSCKYSASFSFIPRT